jgi:hypothetical protein
MQLGSSGLGELGLVSVTRDSYVHVGYYTRRRSNETGLVQELLDRSSDNGKSVRVSVLQRMIQHRRYPSKHQFFPLIDGSYTVHIPSRNPLMCIENRDRNEK